MSEPTAINVRKILIAEDDDDDFNLFNTAILSIYNSVEVLRTENGIMMFSLLETSTRPDIILLDINLPYKNGLMCLKEIKNSPHLSSIRVIINSTSSNVKDIDTSYNLGAEFYLVKQPTYREILNQLNELFKNEFFINKLRPPKEHFIVSGTGANAKH